MDMTITIYKQDGTRQCEDIAPRPIAEDAGAITALGVHIVGEGKHELLPIFVPALCGSPTAWANVFAIDRSGLTRQQLFQLSQHGFKVWAFESPPQAADKAAMAGGSDVPFPLDLPVAASLLAPEQHPTCIADLTGYLIRVYKTGDMITMDYRRDRVNFETNPTTHRIVRSWFG
jgi:hypothetical protein